MSWQVYLSYRRPVPANNAGDTRNAEYGEVHHFDDHGQAVHFKAFATANTGWAPAGAYDLDVSDIIATHTGQRKADL